MLHTPKASPSIACMVPPPLLSPKVLPHSILIVSSARVRLLNPHLGLRRCPDPIEMRMRRWPTTLGSPLPIAARLWPPSMIFSSSPVPAPALEYCAMTGLEGAAHGDGSDADRLATKPIDWNRSFLILLCHVQPVRDYELLTHGTVHVFT
jgi:hypothetical protein